MEAQHNELDSLVKALTAFHCPATTTRRKYACKMREIQTCFLPQRCAYKTTCQTEGIPIFLLFSFIPILFYVWLYMLALASRQTGSW